MKKTMLILAAMGTFLACSTTAFAATSITSRLQAGTCLAQVDDGAHANGYGYVVIKAAKGGGYDVTFQLWNAASSYAYYAKSSAQFLGYLTTNEKGRGTLTVHLTTEPKTWGYWIGLRETSGLLSTCEKPDWPYQLQALWAAANPFNPPPPITP
jgi:hypothetical protein